MGDFYHVRVQSVVGGCLACRVSARCDYDGHTLSPSFTLALGFLWDTTNWFGWAGRVPPGGEEFTTESLEAAAAATPLGRELALHDLGSFDSGLWRAIATRCISCVGVVDRSACDREADDEARLSADPEATYHIAVRDPRWLEHLAPGLEWDSRVWDQDRRRVLCESGWLTSDVLALARGIHNDLAFDRLPVLADALQDAGCADEDLLAHCRGPGPHAPGCWAVDLLLRGPFDPGQLDVATIREVQVGLEGVGTVARLPVDWAEKREAIAALVGVLRSGLVTTDHGTSAQGTIWFQRWGEEVDELCFFPGHDPEWYEFRAGGRAYRVPRAGFMAALRQAGVALPLARP
jgi:hypothetical protein